MPESPQHTVRRMLDELDASGGEAITEAASLILTSFDAGGVLHVAGAGHSLVMVCETFYRAGGLAAVRPLWHPEVLPLNGARHSSLAERRAGLGSQVVAEADPAKPDALVVFSTSGRNPYPVEIAKECAARDMPVIAVTSRAAIAAAPPRAETTLLDHATVVLDTGVPPGDVVHPAGTPRTAPVSTVLGSYVWLRLLAELDDLAARTSRTLPRWTSANVAGGDEANAALFERYLPRIPELDG